MSPINIFPPFILLAMFLFISNRVFSNNNFFQQIIEKKKINPTVNLPIEGLRGFLALAVFFCHCMVSYFYYHKGLWDVAPSKFYSFLGPFGVLLFFFITGYLFWFKCLQGEPLKIVPFFSARFRRIMPVYIASVCVMLLIVAIKTHFTLQVPIKTLLWQILQWLTLGVPTGSCPLINQYVDTGIIYAGVYWTLRLEILFYLMLPCLAFFAKGLRLIPVLFFFGSLYFWKIHHPSVTNNVAFSTLLDFSEYMSLGFSFGMIAAYIKKQLVNPPLLIKSKGGSLLMIFFLMMQFIFIHDVHADNYQLRQSVLLFFPFLFVVLGNNFFGLLTSRGALFLGTISYSIYLIHGIVLFATLRLINHFYPIVSFSPIAYWVLMGLVGFIVLGISTLSYRYIEDKWMYAKKQKSALTTPVSPPPILHSEPL